MHIKKPDNKVDCLYLAIGRKWSLWTLRCLYGLLNGLLYVFDFNFRYLPTVLALNGVSEFTSKINDTDRKRLAALWAGYLRVFVLLVHLMAKIITMLQHTENFIATLLQFDELRIDER